MEEDHKFVKQKDTLLNKSKSTIWQYIIIVFYNSIFTILNILSFIDTHIRHIVSRDCEKYAITKFAKPTAFLIETKNYSDFEKAEDNNVIYFTKIKHYLPS